jgi:TatD DNase family protein
VLSVLVDSHCHLDRIDLTEFDGSFARLMEANREAGVDHMLCVSVDIESFPNMRDLVAPYHEVSVSVGVHPDAGDCREPDASELVELASQNEAVAVGETGLDYYHSKGDTEWQRERFRTHIQAARQAELPLIIHSRDARDDTIAILREEGADTVGGVMHCFTEDWAMAQQAMELGFYISISGIVTFRNAVNVRDIARRVPSDCLLIETDSPWLAPVPHRGKTNRPAWVADVAAYLAELRGEDRAMLEDRTDENFFRLFSRAA